MLAKRKKALRKTTKAVSSTIKPLKPAKTKHSKLPQKGKQISKGPLPMPIPITMTIRQATMPMGSLSARSIPCRPLAVLSMCQPPGGHQRGMEIKG